jgi:predicted metalloprotease with PDZ domain
MTQFMLIKPGMSIRFCRLFVRLYQLHGFVVILFVGVMGATSVSFAQCVLPIPSSKHSLNYSFHPVVTNGKMTLHITLEFKGGKEGRSELELPSEWARQSHLEKAVTDLQAVSAQTILSETESPSRKSLRFQPNTIVRISYVLVKDWDGPLNSGTRFRAVLEPEYFQVTTYNALLHPQLDQSDMVDVHFDWQSLSSSWSLTTSFGTDNRCQAFHGRWHDVQNALFEGGDFRVYQIAVADKPLIVATRGKWSFTDEEWTSQVQKIIGLERTFWQDNDFPYYLVTLAPLDRDRGSTGGTAFTNAFMMHLSRQDSLSYLVLSTLAHETFHTWNPYKMGQPGGVSVYWFQEGFTVYYADRMLFRAGLLSLPAYVDRTNEKLRDYTFAPERNIPNEELSARYRKDSSLDNLPDQRGAVLALWLDSQIRHETRNRKSLDNVMLALLHKTPNPTRPHDKGRDVPLTNERVLQAASKFLSANSRRKLRDYVEQGETIEVPDSALGRCVRLQNEVVPQIDFGLDVIALRSRHLVSGVVPDSDAFKAGLRNGQQVVGMSIYSDDPQKPVKLTVRTLEGDRTFEYYPSVSSKNTAPQYHLDKESYAANPSACAP